jgi:hypothetical protein
MGRVGGVLFTQPPSSRRDITEPYELAWERAKWLMQDGLLRKVVWPTWEHVVFVARYACQPISEVEHWPRSKVLRVSRLTSDMLKEEARQSALPASATHTGGAW